MKGWADAGTYGDLSALPSIDDPPPPAWLVNQARNRLGAQIRDHGLPAEDAKLFAQQLGITEPAVDKENA